MAVGKCQVQADTEKKAGGARDMAEAWNKNDFATRLAAGHDCGTLFRERPWKGMA